MGCFLNNSIVETEKMGSTKGCRCNYSMLAEATDHGDDCNSKGSKIIYSLRYLSS